MGRVKFTIFLAATCVTLSCPATQAQEIYAGKDGSVRNVDARAAAASGGCMYLATKSAIYKAKEIGDKWEGIFYVPPGSSEINCMAAIGKAIFIGTKRGLYRSEDRGVTWRNVFRTIVSEKADILCVAISRHRAGAVIIGTRRGVFMSLDSGAHWQDISSNLKDRGIRCIAINAGYIYAGAESGLYRKEYSKDGWERLIVKSAPESEMSEPVPETGYEPEEADITAACVAVDGQRLYTGIGKKILYSDDNGKVWRATTGTGLSGTANHLLPSEKDGILYCATTRGAFGLPKNAERWAELYRGKDRAFSARMLVFDAENGRALWAVTDKGLYRLEAGAQSAGQYVDIEKSLRTIKASFDSEPEYRELRKAAIEYADVEPEKIKRWHTESRMKAILPKISFGIDKDRSTNYEIYTSATRDYVASGPDDVSDGWDFSVSWELGDLIWSDDQTNIDVRSRLMVQLRNEILDDLRRSYYERKRILLELMSDPPSDPRVRMEKEMRLAELTHAIDDLTGNYLTESLRKGRR